MDAAYERDEYIRYPTDWNTVEKTLRLLDDTPDNIQTSLATAIQIFNVKHLPDFMKWQVESGFKKLNLGNVPGGVQMGGGLVNMHLLYIPTFLSIQILPKEEKQHVRELYADFKDWLWNNYRQDDDFWKINAYGWKRWEAVMEHMDAQDNSHLLPGLKDYVNNRKSSISLFQTFDRTELTKSVDFGDYKFRVGLIPFIFCGHELHHLNVIRKLYL